MKALFIGLGSIGQRHLRNLKSVYRGDIEIIAYRSKNSNVIIQSDMSTEICQSLDTYYGIKSFYDFNSVLKQNPDIAFIITPTSLHAETAITLAKAGCHLFIEKPLSVDLDGMDELRSIIGQNKIKLFVGFQLRFYSLLQRVKSLLNSGAAGNLLYARAKFGTYLPFHHPYEDYRISYAARKELGGGVILCLMHEIDYLYYLFGFPERLAAFGGRLSSLEMTVEDTASILFCYANNFSVSLNLSFAERKEERSLQIVGDKGKIELDFCAHHLRWYNAENDSVKDFYLPNFERNNLFMEEMRHFIDCVENNKEPEVNLDAAIDSLRISLAVKDSIKDSKMVSL